MSIILMVIIRSKETKKAEASGNKDVQNDENFDKRDWLKIGMFQKFQ